MTLPRELADRLDRLAAVAAARDIDAAAATAAAAWLRTIAAAPSAQAPPIKPTPAPAMPIGPDDHILEPVDNDRGLHATGRMPAKNARLPKPQGDTPAAAREIFVDPRLKPKPPNK